MTTLSLRSLVERERAVRIQAERLRAKIDQLAGQVVGLETALDDLAAARETLADRQVHEAGGNEPAKLLENRVYQRILAALSAASAPVCAKDLCLTLDLGTGPEVVGGMHALLERLVARDFITQVAPDLFELHRR